MEDRDGRRPTGSGRRVTKRNLAVLTCVVAGLAAAIAFLARRAMVLARSDSTTDVQDAIDRGNRAYVEALERADAAAYADLFTSDAISMPTRGASIRGRDAIEASVEGAFRHVRFRSGRIHTSETRVEGNTAYELGGYSFDITTEGADQMLSGRYLVVWQKVRDGWKIALEASQPTGSR